MAETVLFPIAIFLGYRFPSEILHIDYSFVANSKTIVKLLAYVNYSLKKNYSFS